ncbi:MAG: DUF378 domain-containing protein [Candidatus Pacebacteria bacterium]|nr:DUF378 domain-containing protein [Candidatus Paceibacterota bacterium]
MKGLILPSLVLAITGALNWFLVGLFQFNLVAWITSSIPWIENTVYILVGIAGIVLIIFYPKISKEVSP